MNWVSRAGADAVGACRNPRPLSMRCVGACGLREEWKQLGAALSMEWSLRNENWDKVSWISNRRMGYGYEGWDNMWTAIGAVPALRGSCISSIVP
jgi:hypothetical protein